MVAGRDEKVCVRLASEDLLLLGELEVDRKDRRSRCRKLGLDALSVAIDTKPDYFSSEFTSKSLFIRLVLSFIRKLFTIFRDATEKHQPFVSEGKDLYKDVVNNIIIANSNEIGCFTNMR